MSLFRNSTILAMRNSPNGASHVAQWSCSAPATSSSSFVMTVRMRLDAPPRPVGSPLFTEFGLYVDRSGNPDTTKDTVEWEGTAEHVAWHPPYVFIFHLRFIEVRHVETGRLCQIIRGQDLRCTWDGCRLLVPLPQPELGIVGAWGKAPVQRTPVWGVMRTDDLSQGPTSPSDTAGTVVQRVFELVPTAFHCPAEELSLPTQQ